MIQFTEKTPEPEAQARVIEFYSFVDSDVEADPMTVTCQVKDWNAYTGQYSITEATSSFPKIDWSVEVYE